MSEQKSLKHQTEGHGYPHRIHRSTKGRKHKGKQHQLSLDRKRIIQNLNLKELE